MQAIKRRVCRMAEEKKIVGPQPHDQLESGDGQGEKKDAGEDDGLCGGGSSGGGGREKMVKELLKDVWQ